MAGCWFLSPESRIQDFGQPLLNVHCPLTIPACSDCGGSRRKCPNRGGPVLRDVRNEDRSGYVYENIGDDDKMPRGLPASHTEMHQLDGSRQRSSGLHSQKYTDSPVIRGNVLPYQCFRGGPSGDTAKIDLKINTFEAGMCMKTNKIMTKCPKKVGHFRLSIGHFGLTDTNFAEIRGGFTTKRHL